jgi:hypothetical protein
MSVMTRIVLQNVEVQSCELSRKCGAHCRLNSDIAPRDALALSSLAVPQNDLR